MSEPGEAAGAPAPGAGTLPDETSPGVAPDGAAASAEPSTTSVATAPPGRRSPRHRHRLRLVLVFAVLAGAVGYLLVEGLGNSLNYFDTVQQAIARKHAIGTATIRLEGVVVPGSIRRSASGADFQVSGGGQTVTVHNSGSPPQLFQPDIPVVVVGHFAGATSYLFVSDEIMVKHSATYIAEHPHRVRGPGGKVVG